MDRNYYNAIPIPGEQQKRQQHQQHAAAAAASLLSPSASTTAAAARNLTLPFSAHHFTATNPTFLSGNRATAATFDASKISSSATDIMQQQQHLFSTAATSSSSKRQNAAGAGGISSLVNSIVNNDSVEVQETSTSSLLRQNQQMQQQQSDVDLFGAVGGGIGGNGRGAGQDLYSQLLQKHYAGRNATAAATGSASAAVAAWGKYQEEQQQQQVVEDEKYQQEDSEEDDRKEQQGEYYEEGIYSAKKKGGQSTGRDYHYEDQKEDEEEDQYEQHHQQDEEVQDKDDYDNDQPQVSQSYCEEQQQAEDVASSDEEVMQQQQKEKEQQPEEKDEADNDDKGEEEQDDDILQEAIRVQQEQQQKEEEEQIKKQYKVTRNGKVEYITYPRNKMGRPRKNNVDGDNTDTPKIIRRGRIPRPRIRRKMSQALKTAQQSYDDAKTALTSAQDHLKHITDLYKLAQEKVAECQCTLDKTTTALHETELNEDSPWNTMYQQMKAYKEKYGHCRSVPPSLRNADPEMAKLGNWIQQQRLDYKRPVDNDNQTSLQKRTYRIKALEELGFLWSQKEADWCVHLEKLKEFKEQFGHTSVPVRYKENPSLGIWCMNQRDDYRMRTQIYAGKNPRKLYQTNVVMTDERLGKLREVGFNFEDPTKVRRNALWEQRVEELKAYKEMFGDFLLSRKQEKYRILARWVGDLRREYRVIQSMDEKKRKKWEKGEIEENQVVNEENKDGEDNGDVEEGKDQSEDFEKETSDKKELKEEEKFEDKDDGEDDDDDDSLPERINKFGPRPKYKIDPSLSRLEQRRLREAQSIVWLTSPSRIETITSIGLDFDRQTISKTMGKMWMVRYNDLVDYSYKTGHTMVGEEGHGRSGIMLYKWVEQQEKDYWRWKHREILEKRKNKRKDDQEKKKLKKIKAAGGDEAVAEYFKKKESSRKRKRVHEEDEVEKNVTDETIANATTSSSSSSDDKKKNRAAGEGTITAVPLTETEKMNLLEKIGFHIDHPDPSPLPPPAKGPAKKRGRPRKYPLPPEKSGAKKTATETKADPKPEPPVTRGRGRPRKDSLPPKKKAKIAPEAPIKRGRGRPRKHPLPESETTDKKKKLPKIVKTVKIPMGSILPSSAAPSSPSTKRKRGRPRKNASSLSPSSDDVDKERTAVLPSKKVTAAATVTLPKAMLPFHSSASKIAGAKISVTKASAQVLSSNGKEDITTNVIRAGSLIIKCSKAASSPPTANHTPNSSSNKQGTTPSSTAEKSSAEASSNTAQDKQDQKTQTEEKQITAKATKDAGEAESKELSSSKSTVDA